MDTQEMARLWTGRVKEDVEENRGVKKVDKGCELLVNKMCSFVLERWKAEAKLLEGDPDLNFKTLYAKNKTDAQAVLAAITEILAKTSSLDFSFMGAWRPTDAIQ